MTMFTSSALAANLITTDEAEQIESYIDALVTAEQVYEFSPPAHIKAVFNRVCYFRSGVTLN
jgi:hypothetical protein